MVACIALTLSFKIVIADAWLRKMALRVSPCKGTVIHLNFSNKLTERKDIASHDAARHNCVCDI